MKKSLYRYFNYNDTHLFAGCTKSRQVGPDNDRYQLPAESLQLRFFGPVELKQLVTDWI